jgi:hypothetical protein
LRDISDKASEDRMLMCKFIHKISILSLARQKYNLKLCTI